LLGRTGSGPLSGDVDIGSTPSTPTPPISSLSRKGFLLLLGDVKGLDRPIVANFCLELMGGSGCRKGLVVKGLVLEPALAVESVSVVPVFTAVMWVCLLSSV